MMQDTPAYHDSEYSTGKSRISFRKRLSMKRSKKWKNKGKTQMTRWKSAEDLSASTTEFGPSDRDSQTRNLESEDVLQLSDGVNSCLVNSSIMPTKTNSNYSQPTLQPMLASTPNSMDSSPTPSVQSISVDKNRPSSLSVDTKFNSSSEQNSSSKPYSFQVNRYQSGESSDEKGDKKLKNRQSSNEGSFERSISPRDTIQEQSQSRKSEPTDSGRSYDSSRNENIIVPPSIKEKEKKESKSDKKGRKAWYNNLINPTYKSRSEDLKRLFKSLPSDERLIVDYSCALQKDILVHGRLYVTQNYFCFYSKIFGWETYECIKCKEIITMTKEKTALVIPNALQINTNTDKHFLTSFAARDKTYMILFRCWQNALIGQQMSTTELWQYVHSCYGEQLGLTSDDDDYVAPSTEECSAAALTDVSATKNTLKITKINSCEENIIGFNSHSDQPKYDSKPSPKKSSRKLSPNRVSPAVLLKKPYDSTHEVHTDSSDVCDSDLDRDKLSVAIVDVSCPNCITHHVGREMLDKIYGLPIDTLFTLLFTNSKFMMDLHKLRKTTAVQCTNWQSDEDTKQKIRQVTYTLALPTNSLGPKVSHVTETQVMAPHSVPGEIYSIDAEACNGGIPYADSFFVSNHWCLTRESSQETRLSLWTQVKYKKNVWGFMKSVIDKNAYNGVDNMVVDLNNALLPEVNKTQQKGIHRRRRRIGNKAGDLNDCLYKSGPSTHAGDLKAQHPNRNADVPHMLHSARRSEMTFYVIVLILLLLLFMNSLLYYRLNCLENKFYDHSNQAIESSLIRIGQAGDDALIHEWMHIIQQQEKIHAVETNRWKASVRIAADHLKMAEESLRNLQISIPSQQMTKIQSLLNHLHKIKSDKVNILSEDGPSQSAGASDL